MFRIFYPKNIYYFFKSLIKLFFISRNKKYDVIFYYPQHFNRGKNASVPLFKTMIESCKKYSLSYILIEEPDFRLKFKRNKLAIPGDAFLVLVFLLRKVFSNQIDFQEKEQKIGFFLKKIFQFKNVIVLSQSMLGVFRGMNQKANLYDLQHGLIYKNHESYMCNKNVNLNIKNNNVQLLLMGTGFKDHLFNDYYKDNIFVIGSEISIEENQKSLNNINKVLVTLQFTEDHSFQFNQKLLNDLNIFFTQVEELGINIQFYLKNHPRFRQDINLESLLKFSFVKFSENKTLEELLKKCNFHLTAYSTTVFEAALNGVPSFFYNHDKSFIFYDDFSYPISREIKLLDLFERKKYKYYSNSCKKWSRRYYEPYNEKLFINLIQR